MEFGTTPEFFQSGDYSTIPEVAGAFEALRYLNVEKFPGCAFVVYNATNVANQKIMSWLSAKRFFERTGIFPEKVTRTEHGRNKWSICERYAATHFIDDRLEVLQHLVGKVSNLLLFRPQLGEIERYKASLPYVRPYVSWEQILYDLTKYNPS